MGRVGVRRSVTGRDGVKGQAMEEFEGNGCCKTLDSVSEIKEERVFRGEEGEREVMLVLVHLLEEADNTVQRGRNQSCRRL